MRFLKLVNLSNLVLLGITLASLHYGFFRQQPGLLLALNDLHFAIFLLSVLLLAAGAFFIINLNGRNENAFSDATTYNIYGALTILGFAGAWYVADSIGNSAIMAVLVIPAAVIFLYATSLKQVIVLNNFLEALFVTSPLIALPVYDLYPAITPYNQVQMATLFGILLDFAGFIFVLALVLSLVNNLRDTNLDYNSGNATLAIGLGRKRTARIAFGLMLAAVTMAIYYGSTYLTGLLPALSYGLLFLLGPMIWFVIKIWDAKADREYTTMAVVLKYVIFFAAIFIVVINYNIRANA